MTEPELPNHLGQKGNVDGQQSEELLGDHHQLHRLVGHVGEVRERDLADETKAAEMRVSR